MRSTTPTSFALRYNIRRYVAYEAAKTHGIFGVAVWSSLLIYFMYAIHLMIGYLMAFLWLRVLDITASVSTALQSVRGVGRSAHWLFVLDGNDLDG